MASHSVSLVRFAHAVMILAGVCGVPFSPTVDAGVRGQFDFPIEAFAVPAGSAGVDPSSQVAVFEVTIPVSFRTTRGNPSEVEQIEVELTLGDGMQLIDYEPQTSLASDVVGEIEEKTTREDSRNWGGSVAASIPVPGVKAAQIGPSANITDSQRTVRTKTIRRRPKLDAVVVAGTTARGKGVFFQLRPGPEVTLEGAHHVTLRIAAPRDQVAGTVTVRCRAIASEDWILFDRNAEIAGSKGQVKLIFGACEPSGDSRAAFAAAVATDGAIATGPGEGAASGASGTATAPRRDSFHHAERPCPWCDGED